VGHGCQRVPFFTSPISLGISRFRASRLSSKAQGCYSATLADLGKKAFRINKLFSAFGMRSLNA
jgi:hypothetical protein